MNDQYNTTESVDPIQAAYDVASYDLKKFLEGDKFAHTVNLLITANKIESEKEVDEINFICLMIALKIIKYNEITKDTVKDMLTVVGLPDTRSEQIWSDIETYILPLIPELGIDTPDDDGDMTIDRSVTIDPHTDGATITHFGPESVEMRLKNVGAPRITLAQLSQGESLLKIVNVPSSNKGRPRAINYNTHPDPYREQTDDVI